MTAIAAREATVFQASGCDFSSSILRGQGRLARHR